jgi:hypothetical protein
VVRRRSRRSRRAGPKQRLTHWFRSGLQLDVAAASVRCGSGLGVGMTPIWLQKSGAQSSEERHATGITT